MKTYKYEELTRGLRANLDAGNILAAHRTEGDDGMFYEHLTTLKVIDENHPAGAPLYYCADVCFDECEFGSVRLLMVEMPKGQPLGSVTITAETRVFYLEVEPGKEQLFVSDLESHWAMRAAEEASREAAGATSPLENLSFLVGKLDGLSDELINFHANAEDAFAAQDRLAKLRDFTFRRYRTALKGGNTSLTQLHVINLFFIETGLRPGEDHLTFGRFLEFASDAVILHDLEKLPPFPEEDPTEQEDGDGAPDCG